MKTIKFIFAVLFFCFISISFYGQTSACALGSLPSIQFKVNCATLSKDNMAVLNAAGELLRVNPGCKFRIVGYGASNKNQQKLSWDHVNAVKKYITEKRGISETRVIFNYGMEGDATNVDLIPTTEDGPNTVTAPHPNLSKIVNLKCD